jgi:acyl dehydratase
MAFVAKAGTDELLGGDPSRLRRLKVRFSAPVFPGNNLATSIWQTECASEFALRMKNQDGNQVTPNGIAEICGHTARRRQAVHTD